MYHKTEQEIMQKWKGNFTKSLVSIQCLAYNHELYIEDTLEGFLMQETDFPFEIIIHDDASTDSTANIIRKYAKKYPKLIKPIYQIENQFSQGKHRNVREALNKLIKGKYIALCEGDDYWTDPLKIQTQVDFLENNLDYTMCFSSSENYDQTKQSIIGQFPNYSQDKDYTLTDILKGNPTNTCAVMYRNINTELPSVFKTFSLGDWPTHLLYSEQGKVRYIAKNMATYRIHSGGVWTKSQDITKIEHSINMLLGMNTYFERKYEKEIYESIARLVLSQAFKYLKMKEVKKALHFYQKSKSFAVIPMRETIIMFMDCCFNNLLKTIALMKRKLGR